MNAPTQVQVPLFDLVPSRAFATAGGLLLLPCPVALLWAIATAEWNQESQQHRRMARIEIHPARSANSPHDRTVTKPASLSQPQVPGMVAP